MSLTFPGNAHARMYRSAHRWHPQMLNLLAWWPSMALTVKNTTATACFLNAAYPGPAMESDARWDLETGTAAGFQRGPTLAHDPVIGPASYFAGNNNWLRTLSGSLDVTAFTLAAWVRPNFTNGTSLQSTAKIICHPTSDTTAADPFVYYSMGGTGASPAKFVVSISTGIAGSLAEVASTTSVSTGALFHVVSTYDGNALKIYINGILENTSTPAITLGSGTTRTYMGSFCNTLNFGSNWWIGTIGDTRIYNRALNATEVWQLYAPESRWALYQGPLGVLNPVAMKIIASAAASAGGAYRFFFRR